MMGGGGGAGNQPNLNQKQKWHAIKANNLKLQKGSGSHEIPKLS